MDSNTSDNEYVDLIIDSANWTNDNTIEFLQLLQTEPSIWDPKHRYFRNRIRKNDAWIRIKESFSVPCTLKEMKRKRNSLMTTYRENLRRIEDSTMTNSDDDDIFRPSWFAFDVMHSYLSPVYCDSDNSIETKRKRQSSESNSYIIETENKSDRSKLSSQNNSLEPLNSVSDYHIPIKQRKTTQRLHTTEDTIIEGREPDECELYGKLLAWKLKLLNKVDRLQMMNEIDNLVFHHIKKFKLKSSEE